MEKINFNIREMLADCFSEVEKNNEEITSIFLPKFCYDFFKKEIVKNKFWGARVTAWDKDNVILLVGETGDSGFFWIKDSVVEYKILYLDGNNEKIVEEKGEFKLPMFEELEKVEEKDERFLDF